MINDEIIELCRLMHEETIFKKLEYVPDQLLKFLELVDGNEDGFLMVYGDPVIAVFCGEVYPHIYTNDLIAVDQLMYVHPDHRRTGIASILVEEYKKWAKEKGAKMTLIGSSTGFKGADEFFENAGFKRIGGNYGLW